MGCTKRHPTPHDDTIETASHPSRPSRLSPRQASVDHGRGKGQGANHAHTFPDAGCDVAVIAIDHDIDGMMLFLASDNARVITGAVIPVDGGQMARWNVARGHQRRQGASTLLQWPVCTVSALSTPAYHRRVGSTAWLRDAGSGGDGSPSCPFALVVGLGGAATMLAIAAADRTANAYADYLDRSDVGDVVINPAVARQEIDAVIRNLPGVERVTTSALFTVSFDEGKPMRQPGPEVTDVIDDRSAFVLGSHDGRYFDMDRPAVSAGRMPTGPSEAVVTPETAVALDIEVGDVVPMSFWHSGCLTVSRVRRSSSTSPRSWRRSAWSR